ncbi:MAG: quinate 5-dehydrogenase [Syntrophomonadaceae bacterium]|mgnify:CR=1 FL=1|nr:quinate 5-dehydrogenase [Syntrophomonadaceae bacterium]
MKRVVSVSLGSSKRNHAVEAEFLGEKFHIERIGTDGNWERAIALIHELDGKVDALGMGGIDLYVYVAGKRYTIRDARKLVRAAHVTPMVDGSGLKNTLERRCIHQISTDKLSLQGKKVLMVCGVDRFGMAESFVEAGCQVVFGDLIYTVGIPIPIRSIQGLRRLGRVLAPLIVTLPFDMLYPTGDQQDVIIPRHSQYYYEADIIAGDFNYIRRYLPEHLPGKVIITNTTTREDVKLLKERGVKLLITTTPEMGGRSFGTNVMEAVLVAILQKPVDQIQADDYLHLLHELNFQPGIQELN